MLVYTAAAIYFILRATAATTDSYYIGALTT